jgi:hypothetical protein
MSVKIGQEVAIFPRLPVKARQSAAPLGLFREHHEEQVLDIRDNAIPLRPGGGGY